MKPLTSAVFFILVFFVPTLFGQKVNYSKADGRKVIGLSNLLGTVNLMKCTRMKNTVIGTVVKRNFEEDESTIASVTFRLANDKRKYLNLNYDQIDGLGHYANSLIDEVFSLKTKLKVTIAECTGGGSGIFTYVDSAFVVKSACRPRRA